LRSAVQDDMESLSPGLRLLAASVPVLQHGAIDLLGCDPRGRLALIGFDLEVGAESVGRAVARWDRVTSDLAMLRALAPGAGIDFGSEPRLLLVAASPTDEARRLAGLIGRPEVELYVATLIALDERRGVLLERTAAIAPPPAGGQNGIDPILSALPAGE